MEDFYKGSERRQFIRLDYVKPLAYKICNKEIISKLLEGYTSNISEAGLLCNIKEKVQKDDILWLSFDRDTLGICEELEKRSIIYQNGIISKVIRVEQKEDNTYNIGVHFITREEKDSLSSYIKAHFMLGQKQDE